MICRCGAFLFAGHFCLVGWVDYLNGGQKSPSPSNHCPIGGINMTETSKARKWRESSKPINTRELSGDFTRITNDLLRYGAKACGSSRNAYFVCILLMFEFGKF